MVYCPAKKGAAYMVDFKEALIDLLGAEQIIDGDAALTNYAYDWWPVAAKWRNQGKTPLKPDLVVRPLGHSDRALRLLQRVEVGEEAVVHRRARLQLDADAARQVVDVDADFVALDRSDPCAHHREDE